MFNRGRKVSFDFLIQYDFKLTADGVYNITFNIWLTDSGDPAPESTAHEIMLLLNRSGMNPAGLRNPDKILLF